MNKEQRLVIKIMLVIVMIMSIALIVILFNRANFYKKGDFVVPEIESNAIDGTPNDMEKECMYQEARVNDEYIVNLCALPLFQDNKLNIYFTSLKTNKGLIKIKILDLEKNVIGESGLISPNSYVKDIVLNKKLVNNDRITVRVMHYEKNTYYSLGEIKLDLPVRA